MLGNCLSWRMGAGVGLLAFALIAAVDSVHAQIPLTWSGTGASSANQVWGIQAANVMSKYSGSRVVIIESSGSGANVEKLRAGRAQLGHVTTDLAYKALHGIDEWSGKPYPGLRTLMMIHLLPLFIAVPQSTGITTLQDMEGKAFSPGPPGFATSTLAMKEFEVLSIKPNWFLGSVSDAVNAVKDNRVAGLVRAGGIPDANLSEIAATMPIRLLSPTEPEIAKLKREIPTATVYSVRIPGGMYNGIPQTITYKQIGFGLFVGTNSDLAQEDGYQLVKAVMDHWSEGFGALDSFRDLGPDELLKNTIEYSSVPLHAGTVQYLRERGTDVPDNLVPAEFK